MGRDHLERAAADYKYPVPGQVFLKYVSGLFDARVQVICDRVRDPALLLYIADPETRKDNEAGFTRDKTLYHVGDAFWVPESAHFIELPAQATASDLAQRIDAARGEIEVESLHLKGVLYREFSRLELEPVKLG